RLRETLPQFQSVVVEGSALITQIVRADDGGVAAGIAPADPALLEDRHPGEMVLLGEIVGGAQPVSAAAHDDGVVSGLGLRFAPLRLPIAVTGQSPPEERETGEALHRLIRWHRAE